jgi:alpha-L-fucosidase 2
MRKLNVLLPILLLALLTPFSRAAQRDFSDLKLWYAQPASKWVEALPIGNGRLGAMVYGGAADEQIQFNEDTIWTGKPHEYQHEGAAASLATLRQLLWDGKQKQAEDLAMQTFMSVPIRQRAYQPFGDLRLHFAGQENIADYRRELDLDTAIATVSYSSGGVKFRREVFASHSANVIVIHVQADQPGKLSFTAKLDTPHKQSHTKAIGNRLGLIGQVEEGGVRFEAMLNCTADGGKVTVSDDAMSIDGATSATLLLAGASSVVNYHDISADPAQRCEQALAGAIGQSLDAIRLAHVADHQALFRLCSIDLGRTKAADLPTDQRLKKLKQEPNDPQLAALYFQFGRYLLIASSRPGCQPANLQGIWNDQIKPPWDSKWTVNINTEMNYWPAEVTGLSELSFPLFDMIDDLRVTGRKTAVAHYNARGWVLHHNTDLWRGAAPINASNHGIWVSGGAWLCHQLWEHYLFTKDQAFLKERAYPAMKEASEFFVDYLVKDPKTGWLVSGPSNSPEEGGLVMGPTMDHQIIRDLFANTAEAARLLKVDPDFAKQLDEKRAQIAPNQIGRFGQLQEWLEDKDDPKNQHRHVSHLWAVYPGDEINPATPKLFAAARQSLIFRGDGGTGWSKAWKINLWARFLEGDHAYKMLAEALAGNTYPNLFDAHPPFQIDGNFGGTSGIAEMLLQSQSGQIVLLPALPGAWPSGSVKGLCARGGFVIDMDWKDGKLTKVSVHSKTDGMCNLKYADNQMRVELKSGEIITLGPSLRRL